MQGSFRDPSGFLFTHEGTLYRQINKCFQFEFEQFVKNGLYNELVEQGMLVAHEQLKNLDLACSADAYTIIRPERIAFISYPFEWSFSQLKDAALLTLDIQLRALKKGMCLKDASAYNIQFQKARPVFIDSLSFTPYKTGTPWIAYRQFCQHFLAPLALMSKTDIRLSQLLRVYIDGIPLDLASTLLPKRTRWNLSLGLHIHMHAKSQKKYAHQAAETKLKPTRKISSQSLQGILESLKSSILKLEWKPGNTEWFDYYEANNNYGDKGLQEKEQLVARLIEKLSYTTVWDLGANTGRFSRVATAGNADKRVIAWDIDPGCVEANYRRIRQSREKQILPLCLDLTNPSPAIGWAHNERMSLMDRGPADVGLALGLTHHLAIANNVPLAHIATFFKNIAKQLVIEFIPKQDSQVQKLLATREDVFPSYTIEDFEKALNTCFSIEHKEAIPSTERTLFLVKG